jgi:DNA adenine methylase
MNKKFKISGEYNKSDDFSRSPFRYPGGKFYALKQIIPFLEAFPHDEYREPFVGGGSVFFAKKKSKTTWINDLDTDLISTYKIIQNEESSKRLILRVEIETASKERHAEIKCINATSEEDIAFKTYYLNRTSYSGIINKPAWGYAVGASSPPENWPRFITDASKKLNNVKITCDDFTHVVNEKSKGKSTLLYLDPPYFLADQKRAYTKSFVLDDHIRLEECLSKTNHGFLLSYDDCPQVRSLYKWANIYEKSWFYNTANSSGPRKIGRELFITNYDIELAEQKSLL